MRFATSQPLNGRRQARSPASRAPAVLTLSQPDRRSRGIIRQVLDPAKRPVRRKTPRIHLDQRSRLLWVKRVFDLAGNHNLDAVPARRCAHKPRQNLMEVVRICLFLQVILRRL